MISRSRQLALSNYGRDFGWYIEYEDKIVGELADAQFEEMFWDSYRVKSASATTDAVLNNDEHWSRCRFRFRNKALNEYAEHAFCGGTPPFIRDGRILMRALYLLPRNHVEGILVWLFGCFLPDSRRNAA